MTHSARQMIAAYRRSHDEFSGQVASFSGSDLQRASGAAGWSVAQVLSHLGSSSEIALATLRTGAADPSAAPAAWARWDAMPPNEQARGFTRAEGELVAALEALDDEQLASRKVDLGFLPLPVSIGKFVSMRLSEVGLHRWDVDVAFGYDATVTSYLVPILLEDIPSMAPMLARAPESSGVIMFKLSEPDRTLSLHLTDEAVTMTQTGFDDAPSVVEMPAESFVRLVSGRLGPLHTPKSVSLRGRFSLDDIRRVFPGY